MECVNKWQNIKTLPTLKTLNYVTVQEYYWQLSHPIKFIVL